MSSGSSFNLNCIFNYFNTGLNLEGKDPSCLYGKSLLGRMIVAQNYIEFIKRQSGSEPEFPTLEQCNALAALFGTTLYGAEEGNFKKIERAVSYQVNYLGHLYLFPLFVQFGFNLLDFSDYSRFEKFKRALDEVNWEQPLFSQLSYTVDLEKIQNLRGFLFLALLEIKRRTASLPEKKQQSLLGAFMLFCLNLYPDSERVFTGFRMLKETDSSDLEGIERIKDLRLDEEEIVLFLYDYFEKLLEAPSSLLDSKLVSKWILGLSLSAESRLKIASLLLANGYLSFHQFTLYIDALHLSESQRFLLLNDYIGVYGWSNVDDFKAFSLNEDQWFELAERYAEKHFPLLCDKIDKFHITDEKKRAEIALRFSETSYTLIECVDKFKITDEELLWKIFLTALRQKSGLSSYWSVFKFNSPLYKEIFETLQKLDPKTANFADVFPSLQTVKFIQLLGIQEALQPHLRSIHEMNKGKGSIEALSWLFRLIAQCLLEGISPSEALTNPFTASALEYHVPKIREIFIPKIISFLSHPQQKEYGNKWLKSESFPLHAQLPLLCISCFLYPSRPETSHLADWGISSGVSEELCDSLVIITKDRIFKNTKNLKIYIQVLKIIAEQKEWTEEDKIYLLELLSQFDPKDPNPLFSFLRMIPAVLALSGAPYLTAEGLKKEHNNLEQIHFIVFTENLPLKQVKLFEKFHPALKKVFRVPNALLGYAGKLNLIESTDKRSEMQKIFASFIDTVLIDLADPEAIPESVEKVTFNKAGAPDLQQAKPLSKQPMCKHMGDTDSCEGGDAGAVKSDFFNRFRYEAFRKMRYSLDQNQHLHEMFSQHQEIFTQWQENKVFDLHAFMDTPSPSRKQHYGSSKFPQYKGWKIGKTDNPVHLFLCGTEIQSCQSIDGRIDNNICLLAYPMDGKNQLLMIENAKGELVSRRIFRILIDKNNQPVLLLEQAYSQAVLKPELQGLLVELALQTAEEMRLPLVVSASDFLYQDQCLQNLNINLTKYPESIFSLGSSVPHEYSDALIPDGLGSPTNGHFELKDTYLLERVDPIS